MNKNTILDLNDLPNLTLREINIAENVDTLVEVFNYNMNQLLDHNKNLIQFSLQDIELSRGLPGINIKGDDGDRGNSFLNTADSINDGQIVSNVSHNNGDTIIDRTGRIFNVIESNDNLVYSFSFSLAESTSNSIFLPESIVVNDPVSHSFLRWDDASADEEGNISPFTEFNGDARYYRVNLGDYKRSSAINGTLTLTNIIEENTDGVGQLTTDASGNKAKDFSQLILKYRRSYLTESLLDEVRHKLYETETNRTAYRISLDSDYIEISKNVATPKFAIGQLTARGSRFKSNSSQLEILNSFKIYEDDDTFYFESESDPTINTAKFWMNMEVQGNLAIHNLINRSGDSLVTNGIFNGVLIYNEIRSFIDTEINTITPDIGDIKIVFRSSNFGEGWVLCDGNNGTPDLRNRFVMGAGNGSALGLIGGNNENFLSVNQLPPHSHTGTTTNGGNHQHGYKNDNQQTPADVDSSTDEYGGHVIRRQTLLTDFAGNHSHNLIINNTGLGQGIENRPSFRALNYIMYIGI